MKSICKYFIAATLSGVAVLPTKAQPVSKYVFGQNIEHTRACVQGGLSAQLVRNRKFAGKPHNTGIAQEWSGYGRGVFEFLDGGFTRHAEKSRMWRLNERHCQMVTSLDPKGEAGISQDRIALREGVGHTCRAVVRCFAGGEVEAVLRVKLDGAVIAERRQRVAARTEHDWVPVELKFTPPKTGFGVIEVGVLADRTFIVGCVSAMADDNFHGMRSDVVEKLAEIGTSIVRWPGGNFAGEYRWRDGYIEDRDESAPLQSWTEIETHPYTYGYDQNDIASDDIIALCEKLGAEAYFTLNPVFDSPESSAEWMKRTNGKVRRWSLGNEMGFVHMEGPKTAKDYADMVRPHALALKAVDTNVLLTASGRFPGPDAWINDVAVPLNDLAPVVSYHTYASPGPLVYCTPARVKTTYANVQHQIGRFFDRFYRYRAKLPPQVRISLDEWNLWASWYREDGPVEGLYVANMLHRLMKEWDRMGLEDVCYFQAVNENAIRVSPFDCRLTSFGHAMRIMKDHVGGEPLAAELPEHVFATDFPDGTRYVTGFNFAPYDSCVITIPADGRVTVVAGELLEPDGLVTGSRFVSKRPKVSFDGNLCRIELPPASMVAVKIGK